MSSNDWPFSDPPNMAVFIDKRIVEKSAWIYYVGHDADDGAWQFHGPDGFADEENAKVVSLKTVVQMDSSVKQLADLPLGWCAWRDAPEANWSRAPQDT
jgi:hypothetical protein